jgi:predicted nucleic acid-binding Zn ribbon protein
MLKILTPPLPKALSRKISETVRKFRIRECAVCGKRIRKRPPMAKTCSDPCGRVLIVERHRRYRLRNRTQINERERNRRMEASMALMLVRELGLIDPTDKLTDYVKTSVEAMKEATEKLRFDRP